MGIVCKIFRIFAFQHLGYFPMIVKCGGTNLEMLYIALDYYFVSCEPLIRLMVSIVLVG